MKLYTCILYSVNRAYYCHIEAVDEQDAFDRWIKAAESAPFQHPVKEAAGEFRASEYFRPELRRPKAVKGVLGCFEASCSWRSIYEQKLVVKDIKSATPWAPTFVGKGKFSYESKSRMGLLSIIETVRQQANVSTTEQITIVNM